MKNSYLKNRSCFRLISNVTHINVQLHRYITRGSQINITGNKIKAPVQSNCWNCKVMRRCILH